MKKYLLLVLLASVASFLQAQDSAYYHTAFNSAGDSLKLKLHNIIKNHTVYPYSSSGTDTWDILKETDRDPNNSSNVILIYSNRSVNGPQEYNNGSGWNREHVWPRSRGDFSTGDIPGTDVHHLRPCDISVNSTRGNRNFADCSTCQDVIDNGFNTGSKIDQVIYTFEPPDNVKGDIARMIFYMAVRYEGGGSEPDLELTNALLSQTDKRPLHAVLNSLLQWNRQDTVDAFERNRNQVIYSYQGNKNPFIDYPELAEYLWGDSVGVVWKPETNPVALQSDGNVNFTIYPNPSSTGIFNLKAERKADQIAIYNQMGHLLMKFEPKAENFSVNLDEYVSGWYFLELNFEDYSTRKQLILNK